MVRGAADAFDDVRITTAPAEVTVHALQQFVVAGNRFLFQRAGQFHDHSGDAITALVRLLHEKRLLHRMQFPVCCEAFDGRDFLSFDR
jgi:hypothetical protein